MGEIHSVSRTRSFNSAFGVQSSVSLGKGNYRAASCAFSLSQKRATEEPKCSEFFQIRSELMGKITRSVQSLSFIQICGIEIPSPVKAVSWSSPVQIQPFQRKLCNLNLRKYDQGSQSREIYSKAAAKSVHKDQANLLFAFRGTGH